MTTVLATDRARPNTSPAVHDQPSSMAEADAHQRGDDDLDDRAGHGDARHRHQVLEREVQPDAEHQQDDADLGELAGQRVIGVEARRRRADHDAGQHVAGQRLDAQPVRQQAEGVGQQQAGGDGGDQRSVMFGHRNCSVDELFRCYRY